MLTIYYDEKENQIIEIDAVQTVLGNLYPIDSLNITNTTTYIHP